MCTIKHPSVWRLWTHTWDTWSHIRLTLKYQSQWYVFSRRTNKLVNENCLTFHILPHYKTHHGYLMCLYWCMKHQWLWCYMPPAGYIWPWSVLCLKMNHNLIIVAIDSTNLWPKIGRFCNYHPLSNVLLTSCASYLLSNIHRYDVCGHIHEIHGLIYG